MPKVRPLTAKDALAREWKNDDERIRRNIGMLLGGAGLTKQQLAERAGMTLRTFQRRLENPGDFTRREERMILAVAKAEGIPINFEGGL